MAKTINAALWRKMVLNAAVLLEQNKQHVDSLNVFPVPDGDTGTNMFLTMQSAAKELNASSQNTMEAFAGAISRGALRGARGNSGVILSQIFKGMNDIFAPHAEISAKLFAKGLNAGAETAYKAVTKPKEGTILTVVRVMAEFAANAAKKANEFPEYLKQVIDVGEDILQKTPDMLPVLKTAGVVDAGGRGLLVIFRGFHNALVGQENISLEFSDTLGAPSGGDGTNFEQFHVNLQDLAEIEYAYCTELFIINLRKKTTEVDIDRFREKLMTLGDCVLVIGDLTMVKVHVHTNEPGTVISLALELGEIDKPKIENMLEQNRVLLKNQEQQEVKNLGIVSVCAGEGIVNIFKDLSADYIVEGGQTMNPSADDIARAAEKVAAKNVFILPNNKNIILAAEQSKALAKKKIYVIPSKNIPQGLAAMIAFNPDATVEENVAVMTEQMNAVKAGLVTYAVRSTRVDEFDLNEGDIIGIDSKAILAKGLQVNGVTKDLIQKMMDKNIGSISLYYGNDIKEEEAAELADEIREKYKKCDVDIYHGGQPLYYYIVSLE
ncbi:MAG: DAK2 domain-containing protein [Clostridiales bacterium]|jgi:DAK2 domain fusion protein YloV|nr:DAK2 domain-containing protein [Clostridiales bacterium]